LSREKRKQSIQVECWPQVVHFPSVGMYCTTQGLYDVYYAIFVYYICTMYNILYLYNIGYSIVIEFCNV
jgi:hypothetical protein